ncbi:hypothetical protein M9435_006562 [Picochlorum sp. BPE23]|nr:hypothetical protein M9435_006562 [Picochlorum sp. BPE23]
MGRPSKKKKEETASALGCKDIRDFFKRRGVAPNAQTSTMEADPGVLESDGSPFGTVPPTQDAVLEDVTDMDVDTVPITTPEEQDVVGSDLASGSEDIHPSSTASAQRQESSSSQQSQKRKPPAKLKVTKKPSKARTVEGKRVRNVRRSRNGKRASTSAVDAYMSGTNGAKKAVQRTGQRPKCIKCEKNLARTADGLCNPCKKGKCKECEKNVARTVDGLCDKCKKGKCKECEKNVAETADGLCKGCKNGKCKMCEKNLARTVDGLCDKCKIGQRPKCTKCEKNLALAGGLCKSCDPEWACHKCKLNQARAKGGLCRSCDPEWKCTQCKENQATKNGGLCQSCDPEWKCTQCRKTISLRPGGRCLGCSNPNGVRIEKRKEEYFAEELREKCFGSQKGVRYNRQIGDSERRLDIGIEFKNFGHNLECDENQHLHYKPEDEKKRVEEIIVEYKNKGKEQTIIYRFNTDAYINLAGDRIKGMFEEKTELNEDGIVVRRYLEKNEREYNRRMNRLIELENEAIALGNEESPEKFESREIFLFYNGYDDAHHRKKTLSEYLEMPQVYPPHRAVAYKGYQEKNENKRKSPWDVRFLKANCTRQGNAEQKGEEAVDTSLDGSSSCQTMLGQNEISSCQCSGY